MESLGTKVVDNTGDGFHSYDPGELMAFIEFINDTLKNDPDVKQHLPLHNAEELTAATKDGILLCKLINAVSKGTIDERTINKQQSINVYKMDENLKLAINAAASIGCRIVNISASSIRDGKIHLIMGMIWQVMRIYLLERISIKNNPGIILLAEEGESAKDIMQLSGEKILVRWIRYELVQAGQTIQVKEISGSEFKDLIVLCYVMSQIDKQFDKTVITEGTVEQRAKALIVSTEKLHVKSFITQEALMEGNAKIYLMFISMLFEARNGLELPEDKKVEVQKATLSEEANTGTKEERTFQLWINSLGIDDVYVTNFYPDLRDGLVIIKLIKVVWPEAVDEKKYERKPGDNKYKHIANGKYIITVGNAVGIKTAGLTGAGIAESNKVQVLGLLWQIMRANYLQVIGTTTEEELIAWANSVVDYKPPIKNFKDPAFKNSKFLINLMAKLDPDIVDWDFVTAGDKEDEIELNAKYCINLARKLGAKIFITWEDIKTVSFFIKLRSTTRCLLCLLQQ